MTENPTAPRCILPRTSNRSSPSPTACASRGFSAPAIRHADLDAGFLITEDFGSAGVVEGDPPQPIAERYEAATDMLAALHRETLPETPAADAGAHATTFPFSISKRCWSRWG